MTVEPASSRLKSDGSRLYIKFFLKINRRFFDSLSQPPHHLLHPFLTHVGVNLRGAKVVSWKYFTKLGRL
jgi:hypothetical protein